MKPVRGLLHLIVCEGFATGASIHAATGCRVVVAFDAGNLEPVCKALRKTFPDTAIILAGDDDHQTPGNPGKTAAQNAAKAVGATLAMPIFPTGRPDKATDFNDLHQMAGLDSVQSCFENAINSIAKYDDDKAGIDKNTDDPSTTENPFPPLDHRPSYVVLDDWHRTPSGNHRPGVYYCTAKVSKGGDIEGEVNTWFCSPLHVDAITHDEHCDNFGRLLRFKPTIGAWRKWAMPMDMLAGLGDELRSVLLNMGVEIEPHKGRLLLSYLQHKRPSRTVHCAIRTGWHGDTFVLPDGAIGPNAEHVIYQSGERDSGEYTTAGTLQGWQQNIAEKCPGNPLLMLAISASFTGPLLERCHAEGGGLHFFGESGAGKSTLADAACATWGNPERFKRSWRTTDNGLEGAATMFNDNLLALDEINEADPRNVGAIVYALGNGRGKQRASRNGTARAVARWLCFVVSNGEQSIETTMLKNGHRPMAGQAVRLLEIPVSQTYGAWDDLHGEATPAAFANSIKATWAKHHGHAGRAFLERLTRDPQDFTELLKKTKTGAFQAQSTQGQDDRAAARFAVIGLAGEMATHYGVTQWHPGAAIKAAVHAFKLWQSMRDGPGNSEPRQIMRQLSAFISRHGDSRFSSVSDNTTPVHNRVGWWRENQGPDGNEREYLFTSTGIEEALTGFDLNRAIQTLQTAGALPLPGADKKNSKLVRAGGKPTRVYIINPAKLEDENHVA